MQYTTQHVKQEQHIRLLTFSFQSCEDKDQIIVEVGELVELFKFLAWQLRTISLGATKKSNRPFSRQAYVTDRCAMVKMRSAVFLIYFIVTVN